MKKIYYMIKNHIDNYLVQREYKRFIRSSEYKSMLSRNEIFGLNNSNVNNQ